MQVYSEFSIIFVSEFIISLFSNVLGRSLFNLTFRLTGSCKDGSEGSLALFPSVSQVTRLGHSNKVRASVCTRCADVCKQHGSQDAGLSPVTKTLQCVQSSCPSSAPNWKQPQGPLMGEWSSIQQWDTTQP